MEQNKLLTDFDGARFFKVNTIHNDGIIKTSSVNYTNHCFIISINDYLNNNNDLINNLYNIKQEAKAININVNKNNEEIDDEKHLSFIQYIMKKYDISIINIYFIYIIDNNKYINGRTPIVQIINDDPNNTYNIYIQDPRFIEFQKNPSSKFNHINEQLYNDGLMNICSIGYYPGHFECILNIDENDILKNIENYIKQIKTITIKYYYEFIKLKSNSVTQSVTNPNSQLVTNHVNQSVTNHSIIQKKYMKLKKYFNKLKSNTYYKKLDNYLKKIKILNGGNLIFDNLDKNIYYPMFITNN
jgi:hypothetical protein